MIYKLISGKSPRETNPGLEAVECYNKLSDRELFFVLILCDPSKDNPIKTLQGIERRTQAARLAGFKWEPDGKRPDKNTRLVIHGKVEKVEAAIAEYRKLNYNHSQHNKEALRKQIVEIREFLESDKKEPVIVKGKILLNSEGKEVYATDQKALKLAVELGVKLPELEEALKRLEEMEPEDLKFEGDILTSADIPEEIISGEESGDLNAIEIYHSQNSKKG